MNEQTASLLRECRLCPRKCGVDRLAGETGFCGAGAGIRAARAALHRWEEPCLTGPAGSGTVFFSHCTLRCVYCQNHEISSGGFGIELTEAQLADVFLSLQEQGAWNINLVTAAHDIPQILEALALARARGLFLPVVYNSGGYESPAALRLLDGAVDIYLPDWKYCDGALAARYSAAPDYPQKARAAIREMYRQVGLPKFGRDGRMRKGVIIRHLMLPGQLADTRRVLRAVAEEFGDGVLLSLMRQYTPTPAVRDDPLLSRTVTEEEYRAAVREMESLGLTQGFLQEGEAAQESFIPPFTLEGLERFSRQDGC